MFTQVEQSPDVSKDWTKNCSIKKHFGAPSLFIHLPSASKNTISGIFQRSNWNKAQLQCRADYLQVVILSWGVKRQFTDQMWRPWPQFASLVYRRCCFDRIKQQLIIQGYFRTHPEWVNFKKLTFRIIKTQGSSKHLKLRKQHRNGKPLRAFLPGLFLKTKDSTLKTEQGYFSRTCRPQVSEITYELLGPF